MFLVWPPRQNVRQQIVDVLLKSVQLRQTPEDRELDLRFIPSLSFQNLPHIQNLKARPCLVPIVTLHGTIP